MESNVAGIANNVGVVVVVVAGGGGGGHFLL